MVHINVTHSLCGLFPGLIAGDSISFDKQKVSGKEGASVTLKCTYDTGSDNVHLHWYRLQTSQDPQFTLVKGERSKSSKKFLISCFTCE